MLILKVNSEYTDVPMEGVDLRSARLEKVIRELYLGDQMPVRSIGI